MLLAIPLAAWSAEVAFGTILSPVPWTIKVFTSTFFSSDLKSVSAQAFAAFIVAFGDAKDAMEKS